MGKDKPALLCGTDCETLGLVKLAADEVFSLKQRQLSSSLERQDILKQYQQSFQGLGCLGPPVKFVMDPMVHPDWCRCQCIGSLLPSERRRETIKNYEQQGIITKVTEPTDWCSNELIWESKNKFRLCIDPSQTINKALNRSVFQMPTLQEHLHLLVNAKCFSLLDVKEGFLHIPLDEASSYLTTMHTSCGHYRWLRLPFRVSSGPEEFQMRLLMALEDLEGIICIVDDILVFGEGSTYVEAESSHDKRLLALLNRCLEKNIKLNAAKFRFKVREVRVLRHIITDVGMRANPDKVAAIRNMPQTNGVQQFLGMVNYLSPFCNNLNDTVEPLRALTRDNMTFCWASQHAEAYTQAKEMIVSTPILRYFDQSKPVILEVDSSDSGLGGALLQHNDQGVLQPVAFTSCTLRQKGDTPK